MLKSGVLAKEKKGRILLDKKRPDENTP